MLKVIASFFLLYLTFAVTVARAEDENPRLLNSVHKYGVTKCDKFILKNDSLGQNWSIFVSKHAGEIDPSIKEISIIQIQGTKGDTVKTDDLYIQSKKGCFVHETVTVTLPGSCRENMNGDIWYVSTEMPDKDYTEYKNKGGVQVFAKDISVGNFNACVKETMLHESGSLD